MMLHTALALSLPLMAIGTATSGPENAHPRVPPRALSPLCFLVALALPPAAHATPARQQRSAGRRPGVSPVACARCRLAGMPTPARWL